jgi:putative membrane protein
MLTMTYRGFHYRMTLPLLVACGLCWFLAGSSVAGLVSMLVLCVIVVVFTYPWDSWAVKRGVWDFPDDRLIMRIGVLPVEEIFFFVVQTLQVSLLTLALLRWVPSEAAGSMILETSGLVSAGLIVLAALIVHRFTKTWRARRSDLTYAWHLGVWFVPLIAAQWMFASSILTACGVPIAVASLTIGTILSLADVWAVRRGIWFFDERQVTGLKFGGILPWEEVAFFYLTSLLVAQSIVLFVPESLR